MRISLSIAGKIGLGFGILTLAVAFNTFYTIKTLNESNKVNEDISSIYSPSVEYLNDLSDMITSSKMLIRSWVYIDKKDDAPDKNKLRRLHTEDFPELHTKLIKITENWNTHHRNQYDNIYIAINDSLFRMHNIIMESLSSFESYNDYMILSVVNPMMDEQGEVQQLTSSIISRLNELIEEQEVIVENARKHMNESYARLYNLILIMGIILVVVSIIMSILTIRSQVKPINNIKKLLFSMAKGILPEKAIREGKDEIGQMSKALNSLVNGLKAISEFALEIGKGNYDTSFKPLSDKDVLGNSLINMRKELKQASEEDEKRKIDDQHRNWATTGMAKFGEILRKNNDNLEELSYDIIHNLTLYMDANQGGLFLVNDDKNDDPHLEQIASYAYDRRKMTEKRVEIGEGLIGRCVLEKETTHLKDIPDDYITITSGLGDANPSNLLIVPLISNDKVFGVIELASFNEFKDYQIEFIEQVGESIAGTIANVKISLQTSLLLEKSKQQAEEMNAQEEEMRQNMEELSATQEEMSKSRTDAEANLQLLTRIIDMVPFPIFVKDVNARYVNVNSEQCKLYGLTAEQFIGKTDNEILSDPDEIIKIKESDFKVLHENEKVVLPKQKISTPHGIEKILQTTKVPFVNDITKNPNILGISIDYSSSTQFKTEQDSHIQELEQLTTDLAFHVSKEKSLEKKVKELEAKIEKMKK